MMDLLELLFELQGQLRNEAHFDESDQLWNEWSRYNPLIQDMEMEVLRSGRISVSGTKNEG